MFTSLTPYSARPNRFKLYLIHSVRDLFIVYYFVFTRLITKLNHNLFVCCSYFFVFILFNLINLF